jgi:hypothetical protein
MVKIFTLNARDHLILPITRDYFQLSNASLHNEILKLHRETVSALKSKGVEYKDLGSGLVPTSTKNEAGFIFDSTLCESADYSSEAMIHVVSLMDRRSNHAVLHGDLIGTEQILINEIIAESIFFSSSYTPKQVGPLFCIYINNLTNAAIARLHEELSRLRFYVGYVPSTYESKAKLYLSSVLTGAFLKFRSVMILGHEEDRSNSENINSTNYQIDKFGYEFISIKSSLHALFLSFKIESPIYCFSEDDISLSINAVSTHIIPLRECRILLEEAKYKHLLKAKEGKLKKAGLKDISSSELTNIIKKKITSNYVYNLAYTPEHDTIKFNIMLELPHPNGGYPTRLTTALEYIPSQKTLRVITLC